MPDEKTRRLAELVIDPSLDPRNKRSKEKIQEYADNIDLLPPIDIDQNNRILDGIHRFLAHKDAGRETIAVEIFPVESEEEAIRHSISKNAIHGVPLSHKDIRRICIQLCEKGLSNKKIAKIVIRHETVVGKYTKATRERRENELADKIGKLYDIRDDNGKRIYTHKKLAEEVKQSTHRVSDLLDRYYANQIKLAVELQDFTDQELLDKFDIRDKQLTRIRKKFGDVTNPPSEPEPEPDYVEEEVVEAVAEPELTTAPEAQERAEAESDVDEADEEKDEESKRKHTEMEYKLLWLGNMLGLSVWVATDDRKKSYEGTKLSELLGMLSSLPSSIRVKAPRSIERIDVLWLEKDKIIAAFEIEHSTKMHRGLLKMSDMLIATNDSSIRTNIVASDDRLYEAQGKTNRPTFKNTGLTDSCWFIGYSDLTDKFTEAEQNGSLAYNWQELLDEIGHKLQ